MKKILVALVAALSLSIPLLPSSAPAGTPNGKWTKLGPTSANFSQPGLAMTSDGVLHSVWVRDNETDNTKRDIVHAPIGADGTIGATDVIQSAWTFMWPVPDLLFTPEGGLRAIWGGQRSLDANETNEQMSTATAPASGSPWSLQVGDVTEGQGAGAASIGAASTADGTPIVAWGATTGTFVHHGTDRKDPDYDYQAQLGGCCGYDPDIVLDPTTGRLVMAWYSNATGNEGVWAQDVNGGNGQPESSPVRMPGTVTTFQGQEESSQEILRTPIAVRSDGDTVATGEIYVAYTGGYPSQNRILVWQVDSAAASTVKKIDPSSGSDLYAPAIASDGSRIWVLWARNDSSGTPRIYARRSNLDVSAFGRTVSVKAPNTGECPSLYTLTPSARTTLVDVVGSFSVGCGADIELWHTQIQPGLTLKADPTKLDGEQKVKFTVTDAGDPISGATVKVGDKTVTTGVDGTATMKLGPIKQGKKLVAVTTFEGYISDSVILKRAG